MPAPHPVGSAASRHIAAAEAALNELPGILKLIDQTPGPETAPDLLSLYTATVSLAQAHALLALAARAPVSRWDLPTQPLHLWPDGVEPTFEELVCP